VHALAIGGTAVGTGLNTHPEFGATRGRAAGARLDLPLRAGRQPVRRDGRARGAGGLHGALRMLAIALTKIGNDIRLMGSGPRAGLGELQLPENEPGSSIMPGKVNPTQVEALTMVCAQVMGHDVAIGFAASQGQFELNVYKPLIALDVLDSLRLLADAMDSFSEHCVAGMQADEARAQEGCRLADAGDRAGTAHRLRPRGASRKQAHRKRQQLREAALALGAVSAEQFDAWVDARPAARTSAGMAWISEISSVSSTSRLPLSSQILSVASCRFFMLAPPRRGSSVRQPGSRGLARARRATPQSFAKLYGPPRSSAFLYAGRAWMRRSQSFSFGRRASSPARCADASSGKLIWMSAALNSAPANQGRWASSDSMKSSCRSMLGITKLFSTCAEMPRAIGLAKKGIGDDATLSNTSFMSSGDIAEPSAKCSQ
jgi:hypothetical protein